MPEIRKSNAGTTTAKQQTRGPLAVATAKAKQPSSKTKVQKYLEADDSSAVEETEAVELQTVDGTQPPKKRGSKVEFGDDEEGSEVFITHHPRQSNVSDDDDDDHHDGDASTDTKSLSAGTTSSEGTGAAKNTGMTIINLCGTKFRIPFTIWTLVAMLVPIVIVATFTGMSLDNAIGEIFIVEHNTKLAIAIADCATEMMNEREESAMFVTVGVVRTAKL
jgi:hypothetical protein